MADAFVEYRSLLFTVAYEMLGSAPDAEDVVQEVWLRWREVDETTVHHPRAYLVRMVTRQSLNRMRTLTRRRETYVGPWLPEPLLTTADVAEDVALADSVSTAMLVLLERLSGTERAVFVLREVFAVEYDEIAAAVDKSPAAVRQIAHRARERVREGRPRSVVTAAEREAVLERFLFATATGDVQSLLDVLAPDVVLVTDGGGQKSAALRPINGRDKVLRFLVGIRSGLDTGTLEATGALVNGRPGLMLHVAGELDTVATVSIVDGLVCHLYLVRNPDKLSRMVDPVELRR